MVRHTIMHTSPALFQPLRRVPYAVPRTDARDGRLSRRREIRRLSPRHEICRRQQESSPLRRVPFTGPRTRACNACPGPMGAIRRRHQALQRHQLRSSLSLCQCHGESSASRAATDQELSGHYRAARASAKLEPMSRKAELEAPRHSAIHLERVSPAAANHINLGQDWASTGYRRQRL